MAPPPRRAAAAIRSRSISTGQALRQRPQPTQEFWPRSVPKPRYLCSMRKRRRLARPGRKSCPPAILPCSAEETVVPGTAARDTAVQRRIIEHVEAVAGRTDRRAGATGQAALRLLSPDWGIRAGRGSAPRELMAFPGQLTGPGQRAAPREAAATFLQQGKPLRREGPEPLLGDATGHRPGASGCRRSDSPHQACRTCRREKTLRRRAW